jgi:hypothetical protein
MKLGLSWRVTVTISPARPFLPGPSGSGGSKPAALACRSGICDMAAAPFTASTLCACSRHASLRQRVSGLLGPEDLLTDLRQTNPNPGAMSTRLAPRNRSDDSILWRSLEIFTKPLGRCLLRKAQTPKGTAYSLRGALDAFAALERARLPRNLDRIIRRPVARTERSRSSYACLFLGCVISGERSLAIFGKSSRVRAREIEPLCRPAAPTTKPSIAERQ